MTMIEKARKLRRLIELAAQCLEVEDALEGVDLFPLWDGNGVAYKAEKKVRYNGQLYTILQDHTSQENWTPELAASLFALVLPGQDGTDIDEWVQPDSTNPYKKGNRVLFEGHIYESLIDGNIWSPAGYPAGWQLIE